MTDEELAEFMRERDKALIALDIGWARQMIGRIDDDFMLLVAMHRARYNIPSIPDALRHESAAWLRAHDMADIEGVPLLPPGELPEGADGY